MLPVNQVFRMGELRKRLLWSGTEQAIWIDIDSDTALPEPISIAELERLLMERELESIADPFEETVYGRLRKVPLISRSVMKLGQCWRILCTTPSFSCGAPEGSLSEASWSAMVSPIRRCTGY